jgi:microcystin-dependent protein
MSTLTTNQFKSTTIYGNFRNSDYTPSSGTAVNANAIFDRDVSITGNLSVSGNTTYNTNLPTSTLTPSTSTQLTTKAYVDNKTTLSEVQSNNNVFTGTNTFNTSLPTSTLTPSTSTQLTTKSYVDNAISSGGGTVLLSANNTWTGTNTYNTNIQIVSGSSLFIGNGTTDSSTQKLRLTVNASTGKNYMDWTGDNNLYMRIGTTPTLYYTFGTTQLTMTPSILRINNVDINSNGTGFTFGATTANNHYFNGSLNVSSYLTTTNNITCPNIICSTDVQTSSLTTSTITASGITSLNSNTSISAASGTSLVISGTAQTSTPPNSANGTHLRLIATNTADNTYSTITFHSNDSTSNNRNCATIAMYKASTWATSSYPTDLIFYSRPASGNQVERLRLTYDNNAIFTAIPSCATAPTSSNHLCNKSYVDTATSNIVHTTGDESIAGTKTFTGFLKSSGTVEFDNYTAINHDYGLELSGTDLTNMARFKYDATMTGSSFSSTSISSNTWTTITTFTTNPYYAKKYNINIPISTKTSGTVGTATNITQTVSSVEIQVIVNGNTIVPTSSFTTTLPKSFSWSGANGTYNAEAYIGNFYASFIPSLSTTSTLHTVQMRIIGTGSPNISFTASTSISTTSSTNCTFTGSAVSGYNSASFYEVKQFDKTPSTQAQCCIPPTINILPAGMIMPSVSAIVPYGWLLCDGSQYTITSYGNLFDVIKYTYGGSGYYFNLPNLNGCFLRGSGSQTYSSVSYAGPTAGNFQQDAITAPSSVSITNQGWYNVGTNSSGNDCIARSKISTDPTDTSTGISVSVNFPRTATDTRPFNFGVYYYIKT